jgi:large subunit ribosomal protein L13
MDRNIIIDGEDSILGRLASFATKQSLLGKEVIIVNCERVLVSGNPKSVIKEYKEMRKKGGSSLKGPFFPKIPERLVKRTIRGMLSYKKGRGNDALKRIKCHNSVPKDFESKEMISIGRAEKTKGINLKKLSEEI